ncbi:MAG: hypothetical protein J6U50_01210 [Lachnospiraceae bacterium]|nr:hypothetical protein [Lachnospiraceae bacterium]
MSYPNEDLFPKRGKALTFNIGGKSRIVRGREGESSVILINGEPADLYTQIHSGDEIEVQASTPGADASYTLGELAELKTPIRINVNSRIIEFPKKAVVNGTLQDTFYRVCEGDDISVNNFYTVGQIAEFLDVTIAGDIRVNSVPAVSDTKVYEDFNLEFTLGDAAESVQEDGSVQDDGSAIKGDTYDDLPDDDGEAEKNSELPINDKNTAEDTDDKKEDPLSVSVTVMANGKPYTLTGKQQYVYVDIFDKLDFDLKASNGRNIVTLLNGRDAQFMEPLKDGDVIEVRWEALK